MQSHLDRKVAKLWLSSALITIVSLILIKSPVSSYTLTGIDESDALAESSSKVQESPIEPSIKVERHLVNFTKETGEEAIFRCEFSINGDITPEFEWYKNEAPLEKRGRHYSIKNTKNSKGFHVTRLTVHNLDVHDAGFYKCEAFDKSTGFSVDTVGILTVEPGVHNYNSPRDIPKFESNINDFAGLHTDRIPSNEANILGISSGNQGDTGSDVIHHTSYDNQGIILNSNSNFMLGRSSSLSSVFPHGPYCESYRGSVCSQHLKNASIYVTSRTDQSYLESQLNNVLKHVETWSEISPQCHRFAMPLLCFTAFSLCDEYSSEVIPRKVCRDECELLQTNICANEYRIAKESLIIGSSRILPKCELLPPIGSKENTNCIRLGIQSIVSPVHEETCYNDNGGEYRGTQSKSASGYDCVSWSSQIEYPPSEYRELLGHNFCRNPASSESGPWCFIYDKSELKKHMCQVPRCIDHTWLYILSPGLIAGVFFLTFICICCIRARNRHNISTKVNLASNVPSSHSLTTSIGMNGMNNSTQGHTNGNSYCLPPVNVSLLKRSPNSSSSSVELSSLLPKKSQIKPTEYGISSINFLDELGEGEFGKIYRGELASTSSTILPCIIKTLKVEANFKLRMEFKKQADILNNLHHPNVLTMLGVMLHDEPNSMLFELNMTEGDLHEYLVAHSPRSIDIPNQSYNGNNKILNMCDFLHILIQIAAGMEYLSTCHYIHKDLAARNCTVGRHMTVKIASIALSKDVYACDYYRFHSSTIKGYYPLRWMPPEAFLLGKFSTASDIWSFGVLMWEVFSYGLQPYYGHSNEKVMQMVQSKHLLRSPETCPSHMYQLMTSTWNENALKRPSFVELHTQLRNWKAVYDNSDPNSSLVPGSMVASSSHPLTQSNSSDSSHNSSHCSKSSRSLPPPPPSSMNMKVTSGGNNNNNNNSSHVAHRYPQTQPNTPNHSSHYSSQPIKGATSGPLHVLIPSSNVPPTVQPPPPLGPHFTHMNHHHIQQHFSAATAMPLTPQAQHFTLNQGHFLSNNSDHHHFSRPSTPSGPVTPLNRCNFRPSAF